MNNCNPLQQPLGIPLSNPFEISTGIDVIAINVKEGLYFNLNDFLDMHSIDCNEEPSKSEWQWRSYDTVLNNKLYRISLVKSQWREIYMAWMFDPTIESVQCIRNLFSNPLEYTIFQIEYDFDFSCATLDDSELLKDFIKAHFHLSYTKQSLLLPEYDTSYRSNPRMTTGKASRDYLERTNKKIARHEYVLKRRWIRQHRIIELLDCFLVNPMDVVKNSSFRMFDYDAIYKALAKTMKRNIASRYLNIGKQIQIKDG